MMSFEEFKLEAENIDWKHRQNPLSKEHIQALMKLYSEYGSASIEKPPEDSEGVSGECEENT
jgi:hypothetical protein